MTEQSLSARQARRLAIAAQRLGRPRVASEVGHGHILGLIDTLGVVQMDSVNVLVRSHYLPLFSRLGSYPRDVLERAAWGPRPRLFEYWGHEASLLPVTLQPLFRWRMARARSGELWSGLARFGRERRDYIEVVLDRIRRDGPMTGGDFATEPRPAGWWNWSEGKRALEWLFWAGLVTTKTRRGFERVYDLTERVLPSAILTAPTPTEAEAHRGLLRIAAHALGVATAADLRDYFRMPGRGISERLNEMVESGEFSPVRVEGWRDRAYMPANARRPRLQGDGALLSPFDNLIWARDRAERLFGTRIRLEIYTPAHKREHGYYVLPFLLGDSIAARVDLKADRASGTLRVQAAHLEPNSDPGETAAALARSLRRMAEWLGLQDIEVAKKGDLASQLTLASRPVAPGLD